MAVNCGASVDWTDAVFWTVVPICVLVGYALHVRYRPHSPDPLDILGERFARGDIAKEDYEERKRLLKE